MQTRYVDRGRPYDWLAWRQLYSQTLSAGVYSGFDLSPGTAVINIAAGALLLPLGIVVVESDVVPLAFPAGFPPALATDYTVRTTYSEAAAGLLGGGGAAMTYSIVNGILTTNPTDGVVLGWIRHPGAVALAASHITNAPKMAPWTLARDYVGRQPVVARELLTTLDTGVLQTSGYTSPDTWWAYSNPSTLGPPFATVYMPFEVRAAPYAVRVRANIPAGADQIEISLLDSLGVVCALGYAVPSGGVFAETIVSVTTGTWTLGTKAVAKLVVTVDQGTIVYLTDFEVDCWPYGFEM